MNDYDSKTLMRLIKHGLFSEKGCFCWTGPYDKDGYGITSYNQPDKSKKTVKVHRLFWTLINGTIPKEYFICHACDNPKCFNLEHLFLGTAKENCEDRERKGRGKRIFGEKNHSASLCAKDVLQIRKLYSEGLRVCDLVRMFNILQPTITKIVHRKRWKHI